MAGFSCDAQRRYRMGEPQNVFGTAAAMDVVIVQFGRGGGRGRMEVCNGA
jgi:hypothetical protein